MPEFPTTLEESASVATVLSAACLQLVQIIKLDKSIARLEGRILASHAWGVTASWLIAHDTDTLTPQQHAQFQALFERRLNGEPIAYITGEREFYGRSFRITPATLIPRPETELLVEVVLAHIPLQQATDILELGTGSGCIAVSLALERPCARITAIEQSDAALSIAKMNARKWDAQLEFLQSDWFSALANRKFDIIVSNPPYVASLDPHLHQGDVRFEPLRALTSGLKGLDDLAHIIANAPSYLKPRGAVFLEHGYDQAEAICDLLAETGFSNIRTWQDLAGKDRVTGAILSG